MNTLLDYLVALQKLPLKQWTTGLSLLIVSVGTTWRYTGQATPAIIVTLVGLATWFLSSPFAVPQVAKVIQARRAARVLRTAGVDPKAAPKDPDETPDETPGSKPAA